MSIRAGTRQGAGTGMVVHLASSKLQDHPSHTAQLHPQGIQVSRIKVGAMTDLLVDAS